MKIYIRAKNNHQMEYVPAFEKQFINDGHDVFINTPSIPKDIDLAIFWGHRQRDLIQLQQKNGKNYLVMERAYLDDRFKWLSLGYNGLNGRADFCNSHITSSARWDKHFSHLLKPWKKNIEHLPILLVGQVPTDAAVTHVDIKRWYTKTVNYYTKRGHKVIFRKHPLDRTPTNYYKSLGVDLDTNEKLETTLQQVSNCVTFSSNSGVISLLEGIPTIAVDEGSMVYSIAGSQLSHLNQIPDRTDWCNKIAHTQWLYEEIESGEAWNQLKTRFK